MVPTIVNTNFRMCTLINGALVPILTVDIIQPDGNMFGAKNRMEVQCTTKVHHLANHIRSIHVKEIITDCAPLVIEINF